MTSVELPITSSTRPATCIRSMPPCTVSAPTRPRSATSDKGFRPGNLFHLNHKITPASGCADDNANA